MLSPELQLQTLFVLDQNGRITSTREPGPARGPRFALIRSAVSCAWAVRMDIADDLAAQVNELARQEPPTPDLQCEPVHAKRYFSLLGGHVDFGPAFTFPERMAPHSEVVTISDVAPLLRHFRGWSAVEIPERSPIVAIVDEGYAISVCFCARRSAAAAEAGVETAEQFRGRGLASRVTAAWALAIRATSRTPLYSTSWSNKASLGLAKKLSLYPFASDWSLSD